MQNTRGRMFCSSCGTQNNDSSTFCKKCGNRLTAVTVVKEPPKIDAPQKIAGNAKVAKRQRRWIPITGFSVVIVGLLVYVLIFKLDIFRSKSDKTKDVKVEENMRAYQLIAEDFWCTYNGLYPASMKSPLSVNYSPGDKKTFEKCIPDSIIKNPYDSTASAFRFLSSDTVDWDTIKSGQVVLIPYQLDLYDGLASAYKILGKGLNKPLALELKSTDEQSKDARVEANMRKLQVSLAQFYHKGLFPIDTMSEDFSSEGGWFKDYLRDFHNPCDSTIATVVITRNDPPDWVVIKPGQVVYIPKQIDPTIKSEGQESMSDADIRKHRMVVGYAKDYKIMGKGCNRILSVTLSSTDEWALEPAVEMNMERLRRDLTWDETLVNFPLDIKPQDIVYLHNPYDTTVASVVSSRKDPPDWSQIKPGQVIYIPQKINPKTGFPDEFVVLGMGKKRPLALRIKAAR